MNNRPNWEPIEAVYKYLASSQVFLVNNDVNWPNSNSSDIPLVYEKKWSFELFEERCRRFLLK